ncbi:sigma-70 family RNA polymerase sigma factor [Sphingomonas sp. HF-S4]|uniref:Sigma-70 family RNA polymerase sigma factor n=1 Tax=Sphingomonas agrestis TaxID=3080540 RepID=A0ABU3Y389_9SPHN|nr:sigma-70 family RNA polymerase sigma factor [Sphingomonas sp. HF-S4]MDV3455814.1 sigma-70 family RNA polymerase sigma factor [Sphingomonas sp. HF-S4]
MTGIDSAETAGRRIEPSSRLADFQHERRRLVRLAYRMLGSVSEAEDVAQDAWLKWEQVEGGIDSPAAYLTRIVTRLCLDRIKSARSRRETYIGPWLPDPLVGSIDPDETIADDITMTLMLAMERLSPLERAAFLLHDVFDVALSDVAVTLSREPAAVRQLASRARKHVQAARPRFSVEAAEARRITQAFFVAARDGDTASLASLLAQDVEIHSDGGGKVLAFRNVIRGADRVLRLFAGLRRKNAPAAELLRTAEIDGLPGYISVDRGLVQTTALDIRRGKIAAIYIVRNPDKLQHLTGNMIAEIDQPRPRP